MAPAARAYVLAVQDEVKAGAMPKKSEVTAPQAEGKEELAEVAAEFGTAGAVDAS